MSLKLVVHIQDMLNWQLSNSVWSNLKNDVFPSFTKSDPHSHPPITLHHSQVLDTNGWPFVPRRRQMVDPRERMVVKWSVPATNQSLDSVIRSSWSCPRGPRHGTEGTRLTVLVPLTVPVLTLLCLRAQRLCAAQTTDTQPNPDLRCN